MDYSNGRGAQDMALPATTFVPFAEEGTPCHEHGAVQYDCSQSPFRLVSAEALHGQYTCAPSRECLSACPSQDCFGDGALPAHVEQGAPFTMWDSRPGLSAQADTYSNTLLTGDLPPPPFRLSERLQQAQTSDCWTTCDTNRELPGPPVCPHQNAVVPKRTKYAGAAPETFVTDHPSNVAAGSVGHDHSEGAPAITSDSLATSTVTSGGHSCQGLGRPAHVPVEFPDSASDIGYLRRFVHHIPQSTQDEQHQQHKLDMLPKESPDVRHLSSTPAAASAYSSPPVAATGQSARSPGISNAVDEFAPALSVPLGQYEQSTYDTSLEEVAATVPAVVEFLFESFEFIGKPLHAVGNRLFISAYIEEAGERSHSCRTESVTVDADGFADFAGAGVQLLWRGEEFVYMKIFKKGFNTEEVIGHVKMQFESMHPGGAAMKVLTIGNQNEANGYLILRLCLLPVTHAPTCYISQQKSMPPARPLSEFRTSRCAGEISASEPVLGASRPIHPSQLSEEAYCTAAAIVSPNTRSEGFSSTNTIAKQSAPSNPSLSPCPLSHHAASRSSDQQIRHDFRQTPSLRRPHGGSSQNAAPSLEIAVSPSILKGFSAVALARGRSADKASPQPRRRGSIRKKPIVSEKRKPFARFARWWCCDINAGPDLN